MRLYHFRPLFFLFGILIALMAGGCNAPAPQVTQGLITVRLEVEGATAEVPLPAGSTVQDALDVAGVTLGALDRTEPPLFAVLSEGSHVKVIRVTEEFTIEQVVIPFEKQVVRSESLPEGETRLTQAGVNGLREITYRRVYEDGVEVSVSPVKSVVLQEPVTEVVMVGSQNPFAPLEIPGRLVYLAAGNAWMMEGSTGNRKPIVISGDLDGHIFRLSPDGAWLLYTRRAEDETNINTLWAAQVGGEEDLQIDLQVSNVVHFADWVPGESQQVVYSTVEPRSSAPGWQANNDLQRREFSTSGWVSSPEVLLEVNSGGIYGWWGTSFAFAPTGGRLAFARPDGVGVLDLAEEALQTLTPLFSFPPLQTQGDWAWVPGVSWGPTGNVLYTVNHAATQEGLEAEASPLFDLAAIPLQAGAPLSMIPQVGMFAYPLPSPLQPHPTGERAFQVAYLQAIFPTQSDTSRYRLVVMDRDGSNRRVLFPEEGAPGLEPQQVVWSPQRFGENQSFWLAVIYQGNLWLVDSSNGEAWQITGDGLVSRLDWR